MKNGEGETILKTKTYEKRSVPVCERDYRKKEKAQRESGTRWSFWGPHAKRVRLHCEGAKKKGKGERVKQNTP